MKPIVILDFGSPAAKDIVNLLREWDYEAVLVPYDTPPEDIEFVFGAAAIILSGSPDMLSENRRYEKGEDGGYKPLDGVPARRPHRGIFDMNLPILGICYGHQLIAEHFGVGIKRSPTPEYSRQGETYHLYDFYVKAKSPLFNGLPAVFGVHMAHSDYVPCLPDGFILLGSTDATEIAAFAHRDRPIFGLQFHPESDKEGISREVLRNFARHVFGE